MTINPLGATSATPLPAAVPQTSEQIAQTRDLRQAVHVLNTSSFTAEGRNISFTIDPQTKIPVIKVVDANTNEVIEQLPNEYVLRLAQFYQAQAIKDSVQFAQKNPTPSR